MPLTNLMTLEIPDILSEKDRVIFHVSTGQDIAVRTDASSNLIAVILTNYEVCVMFLDQCLLDRSYPLLLLLSKFLDITFIVAFTVLIGDALHGFHLRRGPTLSLQLSHLFLHLAIVKASVTIHVRTDGTRCYWSAVAITAPWLS